MGKHFSVPEGALPDQFCAWHTTTTENPKGTDCTASIAEGWVFECGYDSPEEAINGRIIDGERHPMRRCADFILRTYGPDSDFKIER